ncbi:MAG: PKD domain-containing protein, partial [Chloroflexi bacterium]
VNFTTGSACVNAVTSFNNLTTISSGRIRQWLWDFGDGSTSTLENPGHVYQSTGTYQVRLIVIAPHGCRDTFTAPVTVHPLPVVSTSGDTTVCPGFPVQLNASGGVMYQWKPPSLFTNANAAATQMSTFRDTVVSVTVTDMNGCVDSAFVQINLLPLPPADAGSDTFVCKGGSVQLNATGGAGYSWQPSGSLNNANIPNPIATPPDTTTYIVTVIDTNQCTNTDSVTIYVHNPVINPVVADMREVCRYDSIRIYAAGGTDYTWSPPHGISDVHAQYPFFFPDTTTTYIVQVSNYCFSGMDTVTVLVHPLPGVDAGSDRNLCLGDAVLMTGTGTGTFEWQPHTGLLDPFNPNTLALPDTTTAYILTVTDSNGCRNWDTVVLYVFPPPVPDAGADTMICAGGFVRLNASGGTSYQWAPSTGLSCLQCPDPIASPSDSTAYIVTVSDIPGCARSDTVWVFVQKPVHAPATLDTSLCFGDSLHLGISASHALYYQWLPDDGIIFSDNSGNATISLTNSQTYILAVSNDCFSDTTAVTVDVLPLPAADAGEDRTIYRDETTLLNATGGIQYHWRPEENLENPYDAQTLASPFSTTTYTVEVADANGCHDFDTVVVHVIALDLILVPSAFSPNHDGHNDIFRIIRTLNIEKLITFEVYNRWGEKVFETDDPARGWDGTYREEPQEVGTYVYVIKAINRDNELIEVSGNVTLVR